ncbi:YbaN family protein [Chloroflexus sp.]|uniref:YbaN family protein n=1 Tax=Chloroflexus sp. TaxID=1904827 RepID=UPI003C70848F
MATDNSSRPFTRWIWLTVGTLSLSVAGLGLILPGLPVTPFVLLAAACYMRSSVRLYRWLVSSRVFGPIIATWQRERGLTLSTKIVTFVLVWLMLGGAALFLVESVFMRSLLIGLALVKTIVLIRLRTVSSRVSRI